MDPLQTGREKLRQLRPTLEAMKREWLGTPYFTAEELDALLASPVQPPSADARAKLTKIAWDALKAWDDDRHSRVGKILAALCGRLPGYRADVDELFALLTALPPHEVETPQPASEPSGWRDISTAPKDGQSLFFEMCEVERDKFVPRVYVGQSWNGNELNRAGWTDNSMMYTRPTHWMPLPLAPVAQTPQEMGCRHLKPGQKACDLPNVHCEYPLCLEPVKAETGAPPAQAAEKD